MKKISYSILIPSFNGLALLKKHLPDIIEHSPNLTRLIIVDNGSTDGTFEYLTSKYPDIVLCIRNEKNLFFTIAVNQGFREANTDLIVLLNNDVHPQKGYLPSALSHFDDKSVFAVTFNETTSSWPQVSWRGKLQYLRGEDKSLPHLSAWASGGSAVFRKSIWDELGGLDEIYSPGYWEDIDIGWRAWKDGYRIIWEPDARVTHQHESSFSHLNREYISLIKQRNELIFNWKNITDPAMRREHFRYLFHHVLFHPGYLKVIFSALRVIKNAQPLAKAIHTDKEVLSLINQPFS